MSTVTSPTTPAEKSPPAIAPPRPPRIRAWWLRLIVTVLVCLFVMMIGGGLFNWLASFKQEPPRKNESGISRTYSVTVYQVRPVDLQRVITAFGTAVADREVVVAAQVAGQVIEANQLQVGRAVEPASVTSGTGITTTNNPGDLLVRIDPQTYETRVLQARNQLAQAAAELAQLEQEHKNNLRLLQTERKNLQTATEEYESVVAQKEARVGTASAVRQAELQKAQYQDAVNRLENERELYKPRRETITARMEAYKSDLRLATLDLQRTQVSPPFAGVISEVNVEQGQYVRQGDALIRLTDPARVEIPLSLTLSDYLDIAALCEQGEQIRVALAENETTKPRWFSDPLGELRQAPEADQRTRTVKVYTEVNNQQLSVPLLPGTFVHARIPGPVVEDAVVIPRDALVEGTVFVAVPTSRDENKSENPAADSVEPSAGNSWFARVERRPVTIGRTLQSLALVDAGLNPGEWVVTTNLDVIHDGARLKIDGPDNQRTLDDELARLRTPQVQIIEESFNVSE